MIPLLALTAVLAGNTPAPAALPALGPARVVLDMEFEGPLDLAPDTVAAGIAAARAIWRPYVEIVTAAQSLPDALPARRLRLVITNRTQGVEANASLGWIDFVDGRPATTITVSARAIHALIAPARIGGVPIATLPPRFAGSLEARAMGHAVAHEIGHYLLASTAHARTGLMRAGLTPADLIWNRGGADRLAAADIQRLNRSAAISPVVPPQAATEVIRPCRAAHASSCT